MTTMSSCRMSGRLGHRRVAAGGGGAACCWGKFGGFVVFVVVVVVVVVALECLLTTAAVVDAATVQYDFSLNPTTDVALSPDCQNIKQQRRTLFLASTPDSPMSMPGPTIEADEGDTVRVQVTNHHTSLGATIHYHGIHQVGTPWSDGPFQITQCSLGPLQSQVYEFVAYPAGTHYWHAHFGNDVADGLTGPLIVRPTAVPERFEYDDEFVVFLQDWYSQTGEQQSVGLLNTPFTWIGNPDSLLINGKGVAASKCLEDDGSVVDDPNTCLDSCNDTLARLSTVPVVAGKTYRLRIINSAQLVMLNFAIAGHNMTIVEVEGTLVEPLVVSELDLSNGQRYSVLITADQPPDNYWMETVVRERNIPGLTGRAILTYWGQPLAVPNENVTGLPVHPQWNESTAAKEIVEDGLYTQNVSAYPTAHTVLNAAEEDITRYVLLNTQHKRDGLFLWAVNNATYYDRSGVPLIGKVVEHVRNSGAWLTDQPMEGTVDLPQNPPTVWDYTNVPPMAPGGPGQDIGIVAPVVVRLQKGQVVEFVLQNARVLNGSPDFHPWHSHGLAFWVVGRGEGNYDPERDIPTYNLENPVLRDTVTLWPLGWVAIRFVADNPGVWYFHCHITSHLIMGMAFVIIVQPDEIGDPSESVAFCEKQSLTENSGAVVGGAPQTSSGNTRGSLGGTNTAAALVFLLSLTSVATTTLLAQVSLF